MRGPAPMVLSSKPFTDGPTCGGANPKVKPQRRCDPDPGRLLCSATVPIVMYESAYDISTPGQESGTSGVKADKWRRERAGVLLCFLVKVRVEAGALEGSQGRAREGFPSPRRPSGVDQHTKENTNTRTKPLHWSRVHDVNSSYASRV